MKEHRDYLKTLSDAQLVKLFQEGERKAMDTLVERHTPLLKPFLMNVLRNEEDANDLSQDVWMLVLLRLNHGSYAEQGIFGKWLRTIAYREAILFRIKRDNLKKMKMDAKSYFVADIKAKELSPVSRSKLLKAMEKLSRHMKVIVTMHLIDNIPLNDIAAKLGITPKSVSSTYSKACRLLWKENLGVG